MKRWLWAIIALALMVGVALFWPRHDFRQVGKADSALPQAQLASCFATQMGLSGGWAGGRATNETTGLRVTLADKNGKRAIGLYTVAARPLSDAELQALRRCLAGGA